MNLRKILTLVVIGAFLEGFSQETAFTVQLCVVVHILGYR